MHSYASVALIDRRGWVLMQERDEHPVIDPDCWGFPGGSVEPGETPEQAAYRELEEETGLRRDAGSLALVTATEVPHPVGGRHAVHLYAGAADVTDGDIVCTEGRRIVLVDPDRVPRLRLTASAAATWPTLLASPTYAGAIA